MPRYDNQQIVRDFLNAHPNGATLQQIKGAFGARKVTIYKVLIPMLAKGELILASGVYTLNPTYVRSAPTRGRGPRPTICYPNPIPPYAVFTNFLRRREGETNALDIDGQIVLLNRNNADIIENRINHDPKYPSRALNRYLDLCPNGVRTIPNASFDFINPNSLEQIILQIDRDNSTKDVAISSNLGRSTANSSFCSFIRRSVPDFLHKLDGNSNEVKELVDSLRLSHPHYNPKSLASKVCKYLHQYYFDNDKFFINDKVVRSMLGYYLDYYGVAHTTPSIQTPRERDLSYSDLYDYLDALREAANRRHGHYIKRSDLDHILWYCYKMYKNREL